MAFAPSEVLAIRLYEQQRHQVPDLDRYMAEFRAEYSNFRVLTRFDVAAESGPRQLTLDWPQD